MGRGVLEWRAVAEIVEEGDFEFDADPGEAEHDVASLSALFADGSAGDFALGDEGADIVFRGVGVEGDFRPLAYAQKFVFAPEEALQQTVERRIAGSALEDAIRIARAGGSPVAGSVRLYSFKGVVTARWACGPPGAE